MKKFFAHIRLLRPINLLTGAFAVWVSGAILNELHQRAELLFAVMTVVLYNAAANALNDYLDVDADRINHPNRPLSTDLVQRKTALILSVLLSVSGSVTALFLPVQATVLAIVVTLPLMIIYNIKLKKLPLVGNAVIAYILGLTFLFSGAAFGNMQPMIIPAMLAFGLTLLRELVKDIEDIDGDTRSGLNTYPVIFGLENAEKLVIGLSFLIAIGILYPWWLGIYGRLYLLAVIAGVEIPLVIITVLFIKDSSDRYAGIATKLLKLSTIAGVLAIYLG